MCAAPYSSLHVELSRLCEDCQLDSTTTIHEKLNIRRIISYCQVSADTLSSRMTKRRRNNIEMRRTDSCSRTYQSSKRIIEAAARQNNSRAWYFPARHVLSTVH